MEENTKSPDDRSGRGLSVLRRDGGGGAASVQRQQAPVPRGLRRLHVGRLRGGAERRGDASAPEESAKPSRLNDGVYRLPEKAPIKVDFEGLKKINPDVDGWIYCPGTVIDYPVMHGLSNDTYLHHSYDKTYNASGSIFVDERNQRNFADPVTILYGHHMASGAMFATLQWWQLGSYREEHPIMWLLTPEQDYKVELYSAYTTSAYSNTYEIPLAGTDPSNYIWMAENSSDWHINPDLDPAAHYIVMSTCAYIFEDARSVLHGKLMPVMTAGGELIR